jgi:hypothetical protein
MDHFVRQGYKASQLTRLNRCRIYLQVITLTDIASADGTCIIPDVFIGLPLTDRKSTLQWPSQKRPSETDWALWSSALKSLQPRNRLTTPLGNWLVAEFHQTWFWLRDPHLPHLYRRTTSNTQWEVFQGYTSSVRHTRLTPSLVFNLEEGEVVPVAPNSLCLASVITDRYTILSTASIGPPFVPPSIASPASSPASIQQKLDRPFYVSLLGSHEFSMETLQPFIQGLKEGGISAVTRVTFATSVQMHSWTLFLPGCTRLTWATSRSVIEHVSSAKRLELEGLLSALLLVTTICQACHIVGGSFTLYCLSKSLTHQLHSLKYTSVAAALIDNSDLLCEYRHHLLILEHHCTVDIKYLNFADESDTSQPHNEVVSLAAVITDQQELLSLPLPQLKHISPPHSEVSLYYDGRPLVSKIIPTIRCALYSAAIQQTICKQENWTAAQFTSVDWPAHEVAHRRAWSCT